MRNSAHTIGCTCLECDPVCIVCDDPSSYTGPLNSDEVCFDCLRAHIRELEAEVEQLRDETSREGRAWVVALEKERKEVRWLRKELKQLKRLLATPTTEGSE